MAALLVLHRGLLEIGRAIGQLTLLGLMLALFFIPVFAMLFVCMLGALGIERMTGGGVWVTLPLFFIFIGLCGRYVFPHVQQQITNAMKALGNSS